MSAATNLPPNPPPTAPEYAAVQNQNPERNQERKAEAVSSANKIAALAILIFSAAIITVSCLTLPFPAALSITIIASALTLGAVTALLSNDGCCGSSHVTVVEHRSYYRPYFWNRWWPDPIYTPPIIVNRPVYVRRPDPIFVTPPRSIPPIRTHVPVGGGHSRGISSFRSAPPVRMGGGDRVPVGSRR